MIPSSFRRSAIATGIISLAAACSVGPHYQPQEAVSPTQRLGAPRLSDSSQAFMDSLASERWEDTAHIAPAPQLRQLQNDASLNAMAWLDIVRDTTLVRLIDTALRQNQDLRLAEARINEYRADVGVARAPLVPSLTLNGSESSNQIALGFVPPVAYRAARLTTDLAWELDFWGRIRHGVEAAHADLGMQEASERATVLSLVSDVATSYLQLRELDQERDIAERTLASRKATLELARERYSHGLTSELDVRQFEAQVAAPAVTLAQTERAEAQAEHNLDVLLGQGPTRIPRGAPLAEVARAVIVPDSISAVVLTRRPDVQESERAVAAATARAGMAQASRMPTVSVTGSFGAQAGVPNNLFGSQTQVYQALVGVSFPVFDNKRLSSQASAAEARLEQAQASYRGTVLNALREANDALVGVRAARDEATAQATQANALRQAMDLADLRYQAGLATYLDVLDAQRSLFSAELALSQAQLTELTAAVQLYKALGGAWTDGRNSGER